MIPMTIKAQTATSRPMLKPVFEMSLPRDDCDEFLELVLIYLGGVPQHGVKFMAPGAIHQARWVAKVIFRFKGWMF